MKTVEVNGIRFGGGTPFVLIAGPCVIEEEERTRDIARFLRDLTGELDIPFIFKASYDKANRSARDSFRGPGLTEGLRILGAIRADFGCPVLSDVHRFEEIDAAAAVLDVVQIPAFLCRQTDFIMEIARKARVVNIKKGQFLAPWDVANVVEKVRAAGNERILVTERGASFGYNNLVADFRALPVIRSLGYPVIFDATHSVQLPGGLGTASGGQRQMVPFLARAAAGAGLDGIFMEVHPDPDRALCDGPNSLALGDLRSLLMVLREIDHIVKRSMNTEDGKK
ncbi:MAG: 3-deoxy-8-phosphooctulonate synthase [Syntrophales bacterium]